MTVTVGEIEATPREAIGPMVEGLRAEFVSGRTRPLTWRTDQLDALAVLLVAEESRLLDALRADLGKPAVEAYLSEIVAVLGDIGLVRQSLEHWMAPEVVPTPPSVGVGRSEIRREPYGVVLVIGPWNYPLHLVLLPLVGALAAGNVVVVKPSELAPATSALLAELLPRYLDGVAVVQGGAEETAAVLDEHVDYIFYTGGGRVGRLVMEAAARHLTPVTLELGGKSPVIVDRTADVDLAADRVAWAKFFNAGQTCIAPDYVLADRAVVEPLIDRLATAVTRFFGPEPRDSADFGRIVNVRHVERLRTLLAGGRVVVGGEVAEADRYVAPTILRDVDADDPVMQEEIFGPILPVLVVDGTDEAVSFVNARPTPLALYVFGDEEVGAAVLDRTASGGACVNGAVTQVTNPFLPFGGVGASGMGAYHGRTTFDTFTHRRSVLWRDVTADPPTQYPPYPPLAVLKQALGVPAS